MKLFYVRSQFLLQLSNRQCQWTNKFSPAPYFYPDSMYAYVMSSLLSSTPAPAAFVKVLPCLLPLPKQP